VAEAGAEAVALGVGDGAEEEVLVGVAVGAWLDGAVEVAGRGAGEVFLGCGDDGAAGGGGALDGDVPGVSWPRDGVGVGDG